MDSNDSISTRPDGETWKCYSPNSGPLASYKADAGTGPPLGTISLEAPPDPIYFPRGPEIDREAHEAAKDDPLLSPADAVRTVLYTHLMKLEAFAGAKLIP
jgi:hypothetical protein